MPTYMSWDEMVAFSPNLVGRRVVSRSTRTRNCFDAHVEAVEVEPACLILTLIPVRVIPELGSNFALSPIKEIGESRPEATGTVHLWVEGNRLRLCLPMTLRFFENGGLHTTEEVGDNLTNISFFAPVLPIS